MTDLTEQGLALIEKVAVNGNIKQLTGPERVSYYMELCKGIQLNAFTKPFDFLEMRNDDGSTRIVPYANKNATDQIRRMHKVQMQIISRELHDDVYIVTARATDAFGRSDESIGAVALSGTTKDGKTYKLQGDRKANKIMHAETKAKRRATLSLIGLGMLDESELHSIRGAKAFSIDMETGEILNKSIEGAEQEYIPAPKQEEKKQEAKQEKPAEKPAEKIRQVREGFDAFEAAQWLIARMKEETLEASLTALEYCADLVKDEKREIWELLNQKERDWVVSLTSLSVTEEAVNHVGV